MRLTGLPLLLVSAAAAQTYTALDLGTLGTGATPAGINASGQVAGSFETAGSFPHAFLSAHGVIVDLGALGSPSSTYSNAYGINNRGQVVGESGVDSGLFHAFLYSDGSLIDLDPADSQSTATGINSMGQVAGYAAASSGGSYFAALFSGGSSINLGAIPGGTSCQAQGLNDYGQVVGFCYITTGGFHAFLYSQGKMTDLGLPAGYTGSEALAINNRGQAVGYSETASTDTEAFLWSGGATTDLGVLAGYTGSEALAVNNRGQVVGFSYPNSGPEHAVLWSGGVITDLNSLVTLPGGAYLFSAAGINDSGQIAAEGSDGHAYLLTPGVAQLTVLNPFAPFALAQQAPPALNIQTMLANPMPAESLAADGESALVLAYVSRSSQAVTFNLSGTGLPAGVLPGSLGAFDPNFLATPRPASGLPGLQVAKPGFGPDAAGNFVFLALLWAPGAMPVVNSAAAASLLVTATQQGQPAQQAAITLEPPPLLLVHGIWSSAAAAALTPGSGGFFDFIANLYPHNLIFPADYGPLSSQSFTTAGIQNILLANVTDVLAAAAEGGIAARNVDVVAHGTGGLVSRYFLSNPPGAADLLANPVHDLITIGTPHQGTALATTLFINKALPVAAGNPEIAALCLYVSPCTLGAAMNAAGRPLSNGATSIEPNSTALQALSAVTAFDAIAGSSPSSPSPISTTETLWNLLIGGFLSGQTVSGILNGVNDTLATTASQDPPGAAKSVPAISGIVQASLCGACDTAETASPTVWEQAFYWLTGGAGIAPAGASAESLVPEARPRTSAGPAPVLNLSAYSLVASTNVTFQPAAGSALTVGAAYSITATSATKTISEVLLFQSVSDPADTVLLYAAESPFSISFTPTRLGAANFGAITVFSDNTYALTQLNYTLQAGGAPYALSLLNAPVANLTVGTSRMVGALAQYPTGPVNVTSSAVYTTASGGASVFSIGAGGTITASGPGVDTLKVSYGGFTATAAIAVGTCSYSLGPANQIIPFTAGQVTIQVTTQPGCAWTAGGGAPWLGFTQASGTGNGTIMLSAAANTGSAAESALVTLGSQSAIVTQPAAACSYSLTQTQINAPAAGLSGSIGATTACPVIAASNQSWLTATPVGSAVFYTILPNVSAASRSASLTIGTGSVPVMQAGFVCAVNGNGAVGVADVQQMINEALGASSPANDLNGDRVVNAVDLQIVINAALGLGCVP